MYTQLLENPSASHIAYRQLPRLEKELQYLRSIYPTSPEKDTIIKEAEEIKSVISLLTSKEV